MEFLTETCLATVGINFEQATFGNSFYEVVFMRKKHLWEGQFQEKKLGKYEKLRKKIFIKISSKTSVLVKFL